MFVEDEEMIRTAEAELLEILGYKVSVCSNGAEAVTFYKEAWKQVDIVIIDMVMPEMNGSEAFLKMKDIDKDCKVIISSGFTKNESLIELRKRGLAGFINKPFRDFELGKILAKLLNSKN